MNNCKESATIRKETEGTSNTELLASLNQLIMLKTSSITEETSQLLYVISLQDRQHCMNC